MSRDVLLYGMSRSIQAAELLAWAQHTEGLHEIPCPDFHRLQLEHWIWSNRGALGRDILDIGVYYPRRWLGDGYITCGEHEEDTKGDILSLPFPDESFDGVVLSEVLEHCTDPKRAIGEVFRVLKPGGLVLVTSPYIWPEHGIAGEYRDYWRFTRHGWELLLGPFEHTVIVPCVWTPEGAAAYDILRRFECMGFDNQTQATTGYLCSARKPNPHAPSSSAGRGMPIGFEDPL
jgi:SAM-dependent methyltransferase